MVLSMDRWVGKVAIVTGASSGIGKAISERLVEEGLKVVGLARRKDKMDQLAKELTGKRGSFYPIKTDITKEEEVLSAFKWIKENLGPVHVLINNSGFHKTTNLTDGDIEIWKNTFQVNVIGLCVATREAVKDMKENKVDGHIIHINSVAGHQVIDLQYLNVYTASKYAVTALAETLRLELNSQKSKIKITSISPGAVDTDILPEEFWAEVREFPGKIKILETKDIADSVVYALSTPPHVQIQELTITPLVTAG